jgi:CheY-like chemotaxis protein
MRPVPGLRSSPLIAVTGFGQESDRQLSREAGFDYHLVKPVVVDRLKGLSNRPAEVGALTPTLKRGEGRPLALPRP